jgi:hypothetical protein
MAATVQAGRRRCMRRLVARGGQRLLLAWPRGLGGERATGRGVRGRSGWAGRGRAGECSMAPCCPAGAAFGHGPHGGRVRVLLSASSSSSPRVATPCMTPRARASSPCRPPWSRDWRVLGCAMPTAPTRGAAPRHGGMALTRWLPRCCPRGASTPSTAPAQRPRRGCGGQHAPRSVTVSASRARSRPARLAGLQRHASGAASAVARHAPRARHSPRPAKHPALPRARAPALLPAGSGVAVHVEAHGRQGGAARSVHDGEGGEAHSPAQRAPCSWRPLAVGALHDPPSGRCRGRRWEWGGRVAAWARRALGVARMQDALVRTPPPPAAHRAGEHWGARGVRAARAGSALRPARPRRPPPTLLARRSAPQAPRGAARGGAERATGSAGGHCGGGRVCAMRVVEGAASATRRGAGVGRWCMGERGGGRCGRGGARAAECAG